MLQDLRDLPGRIWMEIPARIRPPGGWTTWTMCRAALGYDQINLYGESYGPTAEQVYLQRHG